MSEVVTVDARPLSKEEYEQWVASATHHDQLIKAGLKEVRGGLWKAAKAIYAFNEEAGWKALGYDTAGEWMADPDVTLTRSTYYRMLSAWQEFAVVRQINEDTLRELDLTKASIALPALKRGEATVEEVLGDVEAMGARDMRVKYQAMPEYHDEPVRDDEPVEADLGPTEQYDDSMDAYGVETVPRGVAETLVAVLEAILRELGAPERKAMSKQLRGQVEYALELARSEGLGANV